MTNKMETKAREFWLYDNGEIPFLAFYSHVELLEDTSGRQIDTYHVIEKSAYLALLAEAEKLAKHLSDETGGYESAFCKHPGQCHKDNYDCLADDRVIALQEFAAFKKEMGIES